MKIIMHKNCMDLAFKMDSMQKRTNGDIVCEGHWVTLGYVGKPTKLTPDTTLILDPEVQGNWKILSQDEINREPKNASEK